MLSSEPKVTIVVAPREKFSCAQESLESIYEYTREPFDLVYIDGGSPGYLRRYLADQARRLGFKLIRRNGYLSPNRARNLGLREVQTRYVVFLDNDVVVSPGWLQPLVACAEETGAAIVGPLVCQGRPLHQIVHCAGGACGIREKVLDSDGGRRRIMYERIFHQGRRVDQLAPRLERRQSEHAEFHCMLVDTAFLRKIGMLDEGVLNTREHIDLCITVRQAGGEVYLEPASVVTYLYDDPLKLTDIPFYMLRWGDVWERRSLEHLRRKYDLTVDEAMRTRVGSIGWRRRVYLIRPLVRAVLGGHGGNRAAPRLLEKALALVDRPVNRAVYLVNRLRAS